jgi:deferrochelatase/peroxidase EfeB
VWALAQRRAPSAIAGDAEPGACGFTDSFFDFNDDRRCPVGAHIRRSNPRGAKIVRRVASHTRRLIRRGMPCGPRFDPDRPDQVERGLLGNFIGASLGAQFEAVMCDWVNLG